MFYFFLTKKTEIKHLKSLVRNVIDPSRDLGHVDRALGQKVENTAAPTATGTASATAVSQECEDCK